MTPPEHLDAVAVGKWNEIVGTLPDCEPGTLDALCQYCVAWSMWRSAADDSERRQWSRCCRQWLAELQLTPASRRGRVVKEQDPILRLLENER